ncbi:DUF2062 domain-containing protein [Acidihalobacter prosperus]|uniref:DUF2062 domain-containing protein n=1 Tax=Acidihalobacter prosperus TaxID=160660 RepID=A0A1A6C8H8_9GAMM|nr:DUF2062 domain-containing protein [Acidihalobacter prosperus]OBS10873.1 hypothetical protein Thpro_020589 [Acidihalobacter prosperus]
MAKRIIQRLFPNRHAVKEHKALRFLGNWLHDPSLWHLNRRSVAGAFAVGLFMAFVPFPAQMVGAALLAVAFRVNLAISVALVWLTNPVTIPPMFYFAYLVGNWLLGAPAHHPANFHLTAAWFQDEFSRIWRPLLLGSFVVGSSLSVLGYFGIRLFWRMHVVRRWQQRMRRHRAEHKS